MELKYSRGLDHTTLHKDKGGNEKVFIELQRYTKPNGEYTFIIIEYPNETLRFPRVVFMDDSERKAKEWLYDYCVENNAYMNSPEAVAKSMQALKDFIQNANDSKIPEKDLLD